MRVASLGRKRYIITFIDDSSEWCELVFIEQKNQVMDEFNRFMVLLNAQQGKKP